MMAPYYLSASFVFISHGNHLPEVALPARDTRLARERRPLLARASPERERCCLICQGPLRRPGSGPSSSRPSRVQNCRETARGLRLQVRVLQRRHSSDNI
ncbi:hypothetical protein BV20DRAFT_549759 [Pilatotrama ljubarskyi]|nr:hypothetical protein BV20DRAFT_549759 [Pilatotrama ljubarskyi]